MTRLQLPVPARLALTAIAVACAFTATACESTTLWDECPLSNSIIEACAEDADQTDFNCVVGVHPLCDESICASWRGNTARCSLGCDDEAADDDKAGCPTGSHCMSHLDLAFCVLAADLTELELSGTPGSTVRGGTE